MTDIPNASYINNFQTLLSVQSDEPDLIISSKCEVIYGKDENEYAFRAVTSTMKSFSFQSNPLLRLINNYAFYQCSSLTNIDLSQCTKLTSIGKYAFAYCSSVTNILLPEGLTTIGTYSISYMKLTSIIIPSTVKSIGSAGVGRMKTLTTITFAANSKLERIVFNNFISDGLTSFQVPESVSYMSGTAFSGVRTIERVSVHPSNKNFWSDGKVIYDMKNTTLIYFASAITGSYQILPSVTSLSSGAFFQTSLSSIEIPKSVKAIGSYCFAVASNLKQIELPPQIKIIEEFAFTGSGLTSIVIPDNVTIIKDGAFSNCGALRNIKLPKNLNEIKGNAFPSGRVNIEIDSSSAIYLDSQYILYSNENTSVSQYFGSSNSITIPNKVQYIHAGAFKSKQSLVSVSFEENSDLQYIEREAFVNCINLVYFSFGNKLISIGLNAFSNTQLTMDIVFPSNLTLIDSDAFSNIATLKSISFSSVKPLVINRESFINYSALKTVTFSCTNNISLGISCFSGCSSLEGINIPLYVKQVSTSCFENSGIKSVTFESQKSSFDIIPSLFFKGCRGLSKIIIPPSIVTLGSECFSWTSIESITIPSSVETISMQCFKDCRSLASITIDSSSQLSRIEYLSFENCFKLSTINRFESAGFICDGIAVYSIGYDRLVVYPPASTRAFFTLKDTINRVEDSAFLMCRNIESIMLPDSGITSIGRSAFRGCSSLKHISIPSSITSIGESAFTDCPLLRCGAVVQNKTRPFLFMLAQSGLHISISNTSDCFIQTCPFRCHQSNVVSIFSISVFILMYI